MKKVNLRQALEELKQARNLAQRLAATSNLVNQTAYKAGQFLYGTAEAKPKKTADHTKPLGLPELVPTPSAELEVNAIPQPSSNPISEDEVDYFTKGLMQLNDELKALRLAKDQAETDIEKNAIYFKISRLERTRREYLAKHRNHDE